jgi:hypothetical protein
MDPPLQDPILPAGFAAGIVERFLSPVSGKEPGTETNLIRFDRRRPQQRAQPRHARRTNQERKSTT